VHVETIRYYERIGLAPRPTRSANGRRDYDAQAVGRFAFIRRARDMGFPLSEISALLALAENEEPCRQAHALASKHRNAIRAKIQALKELERLLTDLTENCIQTDAGACPLINALKDSVT
jgi:MerR family mercuric resistance operon transcriptional regulator